MRASLILSTFYDMFISHLYLIIYHLLLSLVRKRRQRRKGRKGRQGPNNQEGTSVSFIEGWFAGKYFVFHMTHDVVKNTIHVPLYIYNLTFLSTLITHPIILTVVPRW